MDQDRIWAPWRLSYLIGDKSATEGPEPAAWLDGANHDCFLCRGAARYADDTAARRQHLVVAESERMIALLNLYPYNNGHLLVAPRRHVALLHELSDDEHLEAMHLLARFSQLLSELIKAQGFNIGLNLNRPAGAGVPGHLHWHLVPRWTGDSNFMPVTADTRVISQSLEGLWEAIVEAAGG
jgi:ATP adenylyltransferase